MTDNEPNTNDYSSRRDLIKSATATGAVMSLTPLTGCLTIFGPDAETSTTGVDNPTPEETVTTVAPNGDSSGQSNQEDTASSSNENDILEADTGDSSNNGEGAQTEPSSTSGGEMINFDSDYVENARLVGNRITVDVIEPFDSYIIYRTTEREDWEEIAESELVENPSELDITAEGSAIGEYDYRVEFIDGGNAVEEHTFGFESQLELIEIGTAEQNPQAARFNYPNGDVYLIVRNTGPVTAQITELRMGEEGDLQDVGVARPVSVYDHPRIGSNAFETFVPLRLPVREECSEGPFNFIVEMDTVSERQAIRESYTMTTEGSGGTASESCTRTLSE